MRSELFDFLGSLHPLMVHLPIGIILLTIAIDVFMRNKNNSVQRVITMGWFFSFFSGLLAALFGWFLGDSGYYFEEQINIHRWSGVALVLLSFMIWILLFINFRFNKSFKQSINITAIILLMLTGHFGGEMTHGQNYLFDNLPFVKKEISLTPLSEVESSEVDSLYVFEDLIYPVLEEKCITCHNENRAYGGLNMNAFESMMEGGNSGSGIQKGKPYESLIYKRISFPQDHPKFMPPAGVPMSYDQIAIMEWWIDKGAKKQMPINLARNDAKMLRLMEVLYKLDLREKTYLETLKLPGLSSEELNGLNDEKFIWRFLNAEKSFLDVKFTAKTIQKVDLLIMQKVKENVTWLNLADCMLSDELLSYLGTFRNLTRLKIQKNPLITDKGIDGLKELKNLSELNLYGTSVTDAAFSTLGQMTALKKLFLWNTLVTPSGIKNFKTQNPEIEVIAGL
ncbi:MAG: c-type cytochrome domain-containing protein [Bacteroidota bacterium]|nr:c-type cytochrome domain-containing protein [Bacteroidota bacterium]